MRLNQKTIMGCALAASMSVLMMGASVPARAATFTFDLNNSFASNENAAVVLTPVAPFGGPTGMLGPTGFTFGPNQGLSLPSTDIGSVYNIEMTFSLTTTSGFRKLVDFKNQTSDNGLYNFSGQLDYFLFAAGSTVTIPANTLVTVDLSRNASGQVTGFVNGVQQFTFTDGTGDATTSTVLLFFVDDTQTSGTESSAGFVDRIQISDTPFSPTSPVPLPATLPLFASGLAGLGLLGWRRKKAAAG
jgi:hypothetical protein